MRSRYVCMEAVECPCCVSCSERRSRLAGATCEDRCTANRVGKPANEAHRWSASAPQFRRPPGGPRPESRPIGTARLWTARTPRRRATCSSAETRTSPEPSTERISRKRREAHEREWRRGMEALWKRPTAANRSRRRRRPREKIAISRRFAARGGSPRRTCRHLLSSGSEVRVLPGALEKAMESARFPVSCR
jgi:hypothetical protein